MISFGGCVCEMWTTWICSPVAVPGQPPIPAGTLFLQGSSDRGPATGVPQQGWRAFSSKPVKWTIRRFYWLTRRTRPFLQLWRHGSDFLYTKNSAMGRSDCIYTKNSARPSWGTMRQKMTIFKVGNSVCRGSKIFSRSFHFIFLMKNRGTMQQKMSIFKGRKKGFAGVRKFQVEFWWVF